MDNLAIVIITYSDYRSIVTMIISFRKNKMDIIDIYRPLDLKVTHS